MVMTHTTILESSEHASVDSQWEIDLLELLSARQEKVGISIESIPQETFEALDKLGSLPGFSSKKQSRAVAKKPRKYKPYVKANVAAFVRACLNVSIQHQLSFTEVSQLGISSAGVAVLAIRSIAELAKKIGISNDRAQQIITILLILGFMRRIRAGRQFIYVISLEPYTPYPSPQAVRNDLIKLHHEISIEDNTRSQSSKNRRAGFRRLIEKVLIRFEDSYGLTTEASPSLIDVETTKALQDIKALLQSRVAPPLCEDLMGEITSVVTKRLTGKSWSYAPTKTTFNAQNRFVGTDQETTLSPSNRLFLPHATSATFLSEGNESTFLSADVVSLHTHEEKKRRPNKGNSTRHTVSDTVTRGVSPCNSQLNRQKTTENVDSIPNDEIRYTEFSNISKDSSLVITEFSNKGKKQKRKRSKESTFIQENPQESILSNIKKDNDNSVSFVLSEEEIRYQAQLLSYRFDHSDESIGLYTTRLREDPWILRISIIDALVRGRFPDPGYKPQHLRGGWVSKCYKAYRTGKKEIPAEVLAWAQTSYSYDDIEDVLDEVSTWQNSNSSKLTRPFPDEVIIDSLSLRDFWKEDAAYGLERRGIFYVDMNGELLLCKKYEEYRFNALSFLQEEGESLVLSPETEYEVQNYLQWVQLWADSSQIGEGSDQINQEVQDCNNEGTDAISSSAQHDDRIVGGDPIGWSNLELVCEKADVIVQALPPYFLAEVYPTEQRTYGIVITNQCIESDQVVLNSEDQFQDLLQLIEQERASESEITGWSVPAIAEWWIDQLRAVLSEHYHFEVQAAEDNRYIVSIADTCNGQRYVFENNPQIESFLSEYYAPQERGLVQAEA